MAREVKLPKELAKQLEQQPGEEFIPYMYRKDAVVQQWEREGKRILSVPYADSAAVYLVVKEKPLQIAHIPVGDAWHLPPAFIRGLRLEDLIGASRGRIAGFQRG